MDLNTANRIYFIGIGGIGMSALARYFNYKGCKVSGYDKTETELTDQLINEGMQIHFEDDIDLLDKDADVVVYTPAIPKTHKEYNFYVSNNYPVLKRSKVLGLLSENKFTIAVAGSHGKTTVSSMIAWILKHSGYDCSAFLGGICVNFNSNFVAGDNNVIVAEADEFDRSFLQLTPDIAVITSTDS
ncbi:MAG: UDP-N-acetylmuramate--L-alanine ligase, partial [Fimbriimonadaceae bacterium]|nr:UDP-N-acetylmuramate--L-alanine ligase [Chitinophagales bacterium]